MTRCRALVAGFGRPAMRDLDFGRQVIDWLQQLDWPDGVVVEDLVCSTALVLHRLKELGPAKVVLVGAVPRGLDAPGTVRRYRPNLTRPGPAGAHPSLEDWATGLPDVDHILALARHWGGLPADTVVIEVEPVDTSFGLGFSEELAECFDPILDLVREELMEVAAPPDLATADDAFTEVGPVEASQAMSDLVWYAGEHATARLQSRRAPAPAGLALAGRVRPWGVCVESGGDWFDVVALDGGGAGVVVGNVAGRGVEVAATMSDLRAAARAYAVLDGDSPSRVVGHLDRLAETTGLGREARLVYLAVELETGDVRFTNAGGCPPLVLDPASPHGRFVEAARSGPLGTVAGASRPEATLQLTPGATLLVFTDGLVQSRVTARAAGLERLRRAAVGGPSALEDLCDHVVASCTARRDDDVCLLGLRLAGDGALLSERFTRTGDA